MTLSEYIQQCEDDRKVNTPHYLLCVQIRDAKLPEPLCEMELVEGRRFASDLYWPGEFCVEIDGLYSFGGKKGQTGGHLQPTGYTKDVFKQLEIAIAHGVPTYHFVPEQINNLYALWWLTLKLTGVDTGRPSYNPGIKSKKIKEKTNGKKVTASKVKPRAAKNSQSISV